MAALGGQFGDIAFGVDGVFVAAECDEVEAHEPANLTERAVVYWGFVIVWGDGSGPPDGPWRDRRGPSPSGVRRWNATVGWGPFYWDPTERRRPAAGIPCVCTPGLLPSAHDLPLRVTAAPIAFAVLLHELGNCSSHCSSRSNPHWRTATALRASSGVAVGALCMPQTISVISDRSL